VIAHLPATSGPATELILGTHWQRNYVYMDHSPGRQVTILDVTDPSAPKSAGEFTLPAPPAGDNVTTIVGNAALVSSVPPAPVRQTVTIMSFADPEHPAVVRQFSGVTAMAKDPQRGLTYLANREGLWVLRAQPAINVQLERQYEHHVIYSH